MAAPPPLPCTSKQLTSPSLSLVETAPDEDDVNNRILLQQGLTEDSEEVSGYTQAAKAPCEKWLSLNLQEDKYSNEAVLGDDDDSMVVAAEVELVYYDEVDTYFITETPHSLKVLFT